MCLPNSTLKQPGNGHHGWIGAYCQRVVHEETCIDCRTALGDGAGRGTSCYKRSTIVGRHVRRPTGRWSKRPSAGSQAPTTGVICLEEMTATFCNVATSPNTNC